jgi:hypothetical protein
VSLDVPQTSSVKTALTKPHQTDEENTQEASQKASIQKGTSSWKISETISTGATAGR